MFPHHRVPARLASTAVLLVAAGIPSIVSAAPFAHAAPSTQPAPLGGIIGRIWQDNNRNGIQDQGEPGISDVTMTATWRTSAGPANTLTATTGAGGDYRFANLPAGAYTVQTEAFNSSQYVFTRLDVGDDAMDSDFKPVSCTPAHEGKDIVGEAETTVGDGTTSDLDGGLVPVL